MDLRRVTAALPPRDVTRRVTCELAVTGPETSALLHLHDHDLRICVAMSKSKRTCGRTCVSHTAHNGRFRDFVVISAFHAHHLLVEAQQRLMPAGLRNARCKDQLEPLNHSMINCYEEHRSHKQMQILHSRPTTVNRVTTHIHMPQRLRSLQTWQALQRPKAAQHAARLARLACTTGVHSVAPGRRECEPQH